MSISCVVTAFKPMPLCDRLANLTSNVDVIFKLEIRDSQNLAKLGLGGKPSLLVL